MSNVRVTQSITEAVVIHTPNLRVTQSVVEVIVGPPAPPPPAPAAGLTGSVVGGTPFGVFSRCQRPNNYDACLDAALRRLRHIRLPAFCAVPEEYRNLLPWDDQAAIPAQAVPFRSAGGITTPTTASGDNTVISLRVPHGYWGLLTGVYWSYSGQGFDQGSGDIIWRVQLNQRYLKDLSNLPYSLGNSQTPVPLTEGAILFSDQTLRLITNVPNLSGLIQIGASTIAGGLLGFYWPM